MAEAPRRDVAIGWTSSGIRDPALIHPLKAHPCWRHASRYRRSIAPTSSGVRAASSFSRARRESRPFPWRRNRCSNSTIRGGRSTMCCTQDCRAHGEDHAGRIVARRRERMMDQPAVQASIPILEGMDVDEPECGCRGRNDRVQPPVHGAGEVIAQILGARAIDGWCENCSRSAKNTHVVRSIVRITLRRLSPPEDG